MRTCVILLAAALLALPLHASATDAEADTTFNGVAIVDIAYDLTGDRLDLLRAMTREPSGNYVVAGEVESTSVTGLNVGIARIARSNGALLSKTNFDAYFSSVGAVATDSIGRVIVAGTTPTNTDGRADLGLIRTLGNNLDTSFGGDGGISFDSPVVGNAEDRPLGVIALPSNEIVVLIEEATTASSANRFLLARFPENGGPPLILPFGSAVAGSGGAMTLPADGKLVVAVNLETGDDCVRPRLVRFAANTVNALDSDFGSGGFATLDAPSGSGICAPTVRAISVDRQGRTLLGAVARSGSESTAWVARLTASGALDSSFSGDGWARVTRPAGAPTHDVAGIGAQSDGAVIVGGTVPFTDPNQGIRPIVSRLRVDGTPDTSYNGGSSYRTFTPNLNTMVALGASLVMDGEKVVLAGSALVNDGIDYDYVLVRTRGRLLRDGFE